MTLKEKLDTARKTASEYITGLKSKDEVTDEELAQAKSYADEVKSLEGAIERQKNLHALEGSLPKDADEQQTGDKGTPAKSLGEHFRKHAGDRVARLKEEGNFTVSVPEFIPGKAAGDTNTVGGVWAPWLTEYDRTVVRGPIYRPIIADLLGQGRIAGNAVTYLVEDATGLEGNFATVAEGGAKPQIHFLDPSTRTDALKKIAAFTKFSDEMVEDLDFWESEINNQMLYRLALAEEQQLLNGDGTGNNVLGLLNRSGIQTEARGTTASADTVADTVFRAMTKVQTGSGFAADGIIIHPLDYQALRLSKDGNGQYFGGGFFQGEYGNGVILAQPPLWGLRTIVSTATAQGQALVGAFQQAATVYRKGGVRVESTNSHASDFTSNLITTRVEERVALGVRYPTAVVKTTITPAA